MKNLLIIAIMLFVASCSTNNYITYPEYPEYEQPVIIHQDLPELQSVMTLRDFRETINSNFKLLEMQIDSLSSIINQQRRRR